MITAPQLAHDAERLAALRATGILDTPPEERFDRITRLLAAVLDVPVTLVSLVDEDRQWFKSRVGLDVAETPREVSFCAHAVASGRMLVVPNAAQDERFHDNPLVLGEPAIRFYAGRPLRGPGGHLLGTLCAIDRRPRDLEPRARAALDDLAALAERELALTEIAKLQEEVIAAHAEAERLLLCILPAAVARALRSGPRLIAHNFPEATVLFADIEAFSPLAASMAAGPMVEWLNGLFSRFDELARDRGVERIKTIGDAYMAAAGVPEPHPRAVAAVAELALEMQEAAATWLRPDGSPARLKIGIHHGPVTAGVIGLSKFAYDLWGHTVNVASRMQSLCPPGGILVTDSVRRELGSRYRLEPRGAFDLKGVGPMEAHALQREAPA